MHRRIKWGLFILTVILNIVAWCSQPFCDWFIRYIFPFWVNVYGRITSLFPFSVGEVMLYLGVLLVLLFFVFEILSLFRKSFKRWMNLLYEIFIRGLLIVFFLLTNNCFIQYHASTFSERYLNESRSESSYGATEIAAVRDYVVVRLNELTGTFERDENGYLLRAGDFAEQAREVMKQMGERYPQLAGYYPKPKKMLLSDFFSQQHMMGYYYPFSMEANYNTTMYVANFPATICHELAHTKGFIYEDEASFIAYLACEEAEDDFFRYSGYLSVLSYLEEDFRESIHKNGAVYAKHPQIEDSVYRDSVFLTREAWKKVDEKAVVKTETVKMASHTFTDVTLKVNGITDGMASYSRVVTLMLKYYDGILY